jgi:hypothetical protein
VFIAIKARQNSKQAKKNRNKGTATTANSMVDAPLRLEAQCLRDVPGAVRVISRLDCK